MIGEPSSPLWAAVKAAYDSWPPDNEDNAKRLAEELRGLGDTASDGGRRLCGNANAVRETWLDEAGGVFTDKTTETGEKWSERGAEAVRLAGTVEQYAAELTFVKQTITAVIALNEPRYTTFRLRKPSLAAQLAAAIAEYLRALVGGEAPAARTGEPGLLDGIAQVAGKAVDSAWTLAFGAGTTGPAVGASFAVPGATGGLNVAVVRDQHGDFYLVNGSSFSGATPGFGAFAGVGVTSGFESDGSPMLDGRDMGGRSYHVGAGAAEGIGGQISYDYSTNTPNPGDPNAKKPTSSVTGLGGLGTPGASAEAGLSTGRAVPLTPGSVFRESVLLGNLAVGNPVPFIRDSLDD